MKRLDTLIIMLAMGASVISSGNASAHPKMTKAEPAMGAVLDTAPKAIQLTFSEPIEPAFSTIVLKRADGATVATEAARIDPASPMVLVLQPPVLSTGEYLAHFAVIGKDGHRREGDIKFTVK